MVVLLTLLSPRHPSIMYKNEDVVIHFNNMPQMLRSLNLITHTHMYVSFYSSAFSLIWVYFHLQNKLKQYFVNQIIFDNKG